MRQDCCGCSERFPRKDPGVFDLLGSSLSCDTTGLTPPVEYLCLRFAERLKRQQQHPKQASSAVSIPASEGTSITALLPPSADTDAPSAKEVHRQQTPTVQEHLRISDPRTLNHAKNARSNGRRRRSTIPLLTLARCRFRSLTATPVYLRLSRKSYQRAIAEH